MAITSAICSTFKKELMTATHNFTTTSGNTFKVALIKANASQTGTYNAGTTSYTTITGNSDELANGNGYTTGGNTLTNVTPTNGTSTTTTALTDLQTRLGLLLHLLQEVALFIMTQHLEIQQ